MSYSTSRLTAYALISSIEEDLRTLIIRKLNGIDPKEALGGERHSEIVERFLKDSDLPPRLLLLENIVDYLDFGDALQLLNRHSAILERDISSALRSQTSLFDSLIPIRNRVMHSRPLQFDDLANTLDICQQLTSQKVIPAAAVAATLERLQVEPSFVLGLQIPSYESALEVKHNLPLPDFDETGFVGRRKEVDALKKLCVGAYPVISVVGEGGLGKTALALKVAYELIDESSDKFDAVVWTSSKTTQLTASEIRTIQGAISTSLGVLQNIASHLIGEVAIPDLIEEIHSYLEEFRILVILDNLENVLDDRLRFFLEGLPVGSKVLITSRVGLGAFEYPYRLGPLSENESVQLLRATARARGAQTLASAPQDILREFCGQMRFNPGFVKWFVAAVSSGKRPEEILVNPELFLDFCMSNVYSNLAPQSKRILGSMISVPGLHTQAELSFLNSCDAVELQKALQQLLTTNMVTMTTARDDIFVTTKYGISDMPRDYLVKHHRPSTDQDALFNKRRRALIANAEQMAREVQTDPLNYKSIKTRSRSDFVIAKFLQEAIQAITAKKFEKAESAIGFARKLAPEYFEVPRVEALLRMQEENYPAARLAFDAAIDIEPNYFPLRYWYGDFLLRKMDDAEGAAQQFQAAVELEPQNIEIQLGAARAQLYMHRYDEVFGILKTLLPKAPTLPYRLAVRVFDLAVSVNGRKADDAFGQDEFNEALARLKDLRATYSAIPEKLRDDIMKTKLGKAQLTARGLTGRLSGKDADEASDILHWLAEESGRLFGIRLDAQSEPLIEQSPNHGEIRRVHPNGFGFLATEDGRELFFHRLDVRPESDMALLRPGMKVVYGEGSNSKGPAAVSVRRV